MTSADAGEQGREPEHDDERHQHQQHVAEHQRQEVEQAEDQGGVAAGAGDQLPGRERGQGALVEGEQVVVELVAKVVLHRQRRPAVVEATQVGEPEDRERDEHEQHEPRPQRLGRVADHVVDDRARDEGHHRLAGAAEDGGDERDLDVALVLPDLAAQPADPPLRGVLAGWHVAATYLSGDGPERADESLVPPSTPACLDGLRAAPVERVSVGRAPVSVTATSLQAEGGSHV